MIIGYNHKCAVFGHEYKKWVFFGPKPDCPKCLQKLRDYDHKMRLAVDRATPPAKGSPFYIERDNRDRRKHLDEAARSSVAEPYPILPDHYSFFQPANATSVCNFVGGGGASVSSVESAPPTFIPGAGSVSSGGGASGTWRDPETSQGGRGSIEPSSDCSSSDLSSFSSDWI